MEKVSYTSPFFHNEDGSFKVALVPAAAVTTYAKRDAALVKMHALGGIHAQPTVEFMKLRTKMMAAKRKIERNGWVSQAV